MCRLQRAYRLSYRKEITIGSRGKGGRVSWEDLERERRLAWAEYHGVPYHDIIGTWAS